MLLSASPASAGNIALTIYNQNFAVVRDTVPLALKAGVNEVRFGGATAYLEPSSVILRDPLGKHVFQVLEQNYRGDPVSQHTLLALNEGKAIQFEVTSPAEGGRVKREFVTGKIIRAGDYSPGPQAYLGYGADALQPIIEVDGKLRFGLPGQPLFPSLADDTILKPTLVWMLASEEPARFDAELSYVTGQMRWEADYNLVLPERGDSLDVVGWVTMDNESGRSFEQARIKLMAGDVSKLQNPSVGRLGLFGGGMGGGQAAAPPVTEKSFDEYHLYTLERPTTLLDRQKKQVEFVRAAAVHSALLYVYDGASADDTTSWAVPLEVKTQPEYGTECNRHVWVFRQFTNSTANNLGMPLPKGRIRFYRRNADGQLEFVGENTLKHTPRDEQVRLFTGNAFDLVGERKRTRFKTEVSGGGIDPATGLPVAPSPRHQPYMDESFEVTLRNHKQDLAEVHVVEHLYRWIDWKITEASHKFEQKDAQTIEFRVPLKPSEEQKVTYTVHYWW